MSGWVGVVCWGWIAGHWRENKIPLQKNIAPKNIFDKNIFGENIFDENIFGENIFGNNIFFGKGLYFPSHALLSTPNIQLPPPLTSYLKLRGGDETKDELTDRTDAMIVPFIVLDNSILPLPCIFINHLSFKEYITEQNLTHYTTQLL